MMESRGHYISDQEARLVAKKMDQNRDGVITYNEFTESVRPKSPNRRM
jgi:Ca2+-binding EF-hand superfamily protein